MVLHSNIADYAWKTIAKIATDVIEKMDMLVMILLNSKYNKL